jgi:hypothetical protein
MFKTLNPPHYQRRIIFPSSYLKPTEWWRLVVARHGLCHRFGHLWPFAV